MNGRKPIGGWCIECGKVVPMRRVGRVLIEEVYDPGDVLCRRHARLWRRRRWLPKGVPVERAAEPWEELYGFDPADAEIDRLGFYSGAADAELAEDPRSCTQEGRPA